MKIRLWKLGNLEYRIMPTDKAYQHLVDALMKRDPDKDFELIWDPAIEVIQLDAESNDIEVVAGPNIKLTKDGNVVKIDVVNSNK